MKTGCAESADGGSHPEATIAGRNVGAAALAAASLDAPKIAAAASKEGQFEISIVIVNLKNHDNQTN